MVTQTRSIAATTSAANIDDGMKEFFTNLLQTSMAGLQASMENISKNVQANSQNIDSLLVTQQYLTTEMHKVKEGESQHGPVLQFGRLSKIDFPKFNGEDVKGWLFRCQQFFRIDNIADQHKVKMASIHLLDRAQVWHQNFARIYGDDMEWEVYASAICERFSKNYVDLMEELKNLKQDISVEAYQDSYEVLINKVDLTKQQAISIYIGGLKPEIGMMVKMFNPKSLEDVYKLARLQDAMARRSAPILPTPKTSVSYSKTYPSY